MSIGTKLGCFAAQIVNRIERSGPGLKAGVAKEVVAAKKAYKESRVVIDAETGEILQEESK
jgi:hypothetical protein